ncbi:MAG: ATP-grasp domain-containing protein, partial [Eggerthellaceae bacterium]|nr:ATP-grasp domain-containing protein [Eggerthellaceae bacterium]
MFILEGPYASDIMLDWLEASQHPTLSNAFAQEVTAKGRTLNLVDPADAAARIDAGERLYSSSESALEWVLANVHDEHLLRCIRLCKDKAETRRALATVDPTFFFRECTMEELLAINPGELPFPLVVKP